MERKEINELLNQVEAKVKDFINEKVKDSDDRSEFRESLDEAIGSIDEILDGCESPEE